jgi:hypothetical protein
MTYDPNNPNDINNPNDPNRPLNPTRDPDLRTTPVDRLHRRSWAVWIAGIVLIAIAAFAITEMIDEPGTDPATTASTTNSEPAPAPASPTAPAPGTPPAVPAQQ